MTNFEDFNVRYHIKRIVIKFGRRYGGVLKPLHLGGPTHKSADKFIDNLHQSSFFQHIPLDLCAPEYCYIYISCIFAITKRSA